MPTPSTTNWPKPKSEDEWEEMVVDAMRIFWDYPNARRYGRKGQKQYGIDVIGQRDSLIVAAQAKNCVTLSEQVINQEIDKTEKASFELNELYFAISGNRDNKLQELVNKISIVTKKKFGFEVFILFFEDVTQYLTQNEELVHKYWQSFLASVSKLSKKSILTIDAAFDAIDDLEELYVLSDKISKDSKGKVNLSLMIEGVPDLSAEPDSPERFWQIVVKANHRTYMVTIMRIAIDVDNGAIFFNSLADDRWIPANQWNNVTIETNWSL